MDRLTDDILEAAKAFESMPCNAGLCVVPATIRNVTCLQVMFRQVGAKLGEAGMETIQANVINSPLGKPLLYVVDTRDWPEECERAFLSGCPALKVGEVTELVKQIGQMSE